MAVFLLIRHAENEYTIKKQMAGRLPGVHLTKKGVKQAESVAERLAGLTVEAIYASPLERTMETAAPIAEKLGISVVPREGLIETDIGDWVGMKISQLKRLKLWRTVQGLPSRFHFPGGESFIDAQIRICREIDTLAEMHKDKSLVICVSHADPIKLAVAFFMGIPLDLFQRVDIGLASVTAIYVGPYGNRLLTLNNQADFNLPKK